MEITIKGIRIESVALARNTETGNYKIENSQYSLISSTDKVLAKQAIGGYGGMVLEPSVTTVQALNKFMDLYKADVQALLGLELG